MESGDFCVTPVSSGGRKGGLSVNPDESPTPNKVRRLLLSPVRSPAGTDTDVDRKGPKTPCGVRSSTPFVDDIGVSNPSSARRSISFLDNDDRRCFTMDDLTLVSSGSQGTTGGSGGTRSDFVEGFHGIDPNNRSPIPDESQRLPVSLRAAAATDTDVDRKGPKTPCGVRSSTPFVAFTMDDLTLVSSGSQGTTGGSGGTRSDFVEGFHGIDPNNRSPIPDESQRLPVSLRAAAATDNDVLVDCYAFDTPSDATRITSSVPIGDAALSSASQGSSSGGSNRKSAFNGQIPWKSEEHCRTQAPKNRYSESGPPGSERDTIKLVVNSWEDLLSFVESDQPGAVVVKVKMIDCLGDAPEVYKLMVKAQAERGWECAEMNMMEGLTRLHEQMEVIRDNLRLLQDDTRFKDILLELRATALKVRRLGRDAKAGRKVLKLASNIGNKVSRYARLVLAGKKSRDWRHGAASLDSDVEDASWLYPITFP